MNASPRPSALPGVIDTLGSAYRLLRQHPYLMLVPLILDVFYWLGPRLSAEPLTGAIAQSMSETLAASPVTDAQTRQVTQGLITLVQELGKGANLFTALSGTMAVPSLPTGQLMQRPRWLGAETALTIDSNGALAGAIVLLSLVGLLLGAIYMSMAAQVVGAGRLSPASLGRQSVAGAGRVLALGLALLLGAVVVGLPVLFIVALAAALVPTLGTFVLFGVLSLGLALAVFLFFTVSAVFLSGAGPLRAALNSITVVRFFSSSALSLFVVNMLLALGMPYVWEMLGTSEAATLVSMLGNAFIGVGLTLACMIFYRDRMTAIQAMREQAAARPEAV